MQIELVKWSPALKQELMNICNKVDRTFLSNRMPYKSGSGGLRASTSEDRYSEDVSRKRSTAS